MTAGRYIVLVDEPGKDLRALPGSFADPESAMEDGVNFQEYPRAIRFLIVQVVAQAGPVSLPASGLPVASGVAAILLPVRRLHHEQRSHLGRAVSRVLSVAVPDRQPDHAGPQDYRPAVLSHTPSFGR